MREKNNCIGEAGLEVIKLEFILKLKIKRNDWLLVHTCPQATNHCVLFEFETVLEVTKLEYSLKLKIKHNYWFLADTCPQAANHCALF